MQRLPLELIYKIAEYIDDNDTNSFFIALSNHHTYNLRSRVVEFHNNLITCVFCGEYSRMVCSVCNSLESLKIKNKMTRESKEIILANYKLSVNFISYIRFYTTTQRIVYNKHEWIDFEFAYKSLKKLNLGKKHGCLKNLMRVSRLPRYWIMSNNPCKIKKIHMRKLFWFKFNISALIKKVKECL